MDDKTLVPHEKEEYTPATTEKQQHAEMEKSRSTPLQRFTSLCSENAPAQGGTGPLAEGGSTIMADAQDPRPHHYVFKRLAKDMPLPGKHLEWAMLMTMFLVMFLAGWNDGSQGPLLPSLQAHYGLNYLVISIIWLFNATGFMVAGLTNVWLSDHFGFGIVAPMGAALQMVAYCLMCWGSPYPLFCFAFVLNGWGLGIQDAQINSLASRMKNANTKMFLLHAVYGLGATVAPLVSTQFVKHVPDRVYVYYSVSLGLAAMTVLTLLVVFRLRTDDQIVGHREPDEFENVSPAATRVATPVEGDVEMTPRETEETLPATTVRKQIHNDSGKKMKRILSTPSVWLLSFYILLYVGVEVTIGGWATSFLLAERGGNNSSGYVSSGFFGGITIGRVILIPVTAWIGRSNSVWVYTILSIVLEIVIWQTYTIIGNAVCFAFVGILLGPMYPIVMMVTADILPGQLQGGAIGFIASMGQVGSAVMPFIAGGIAESRGVWILQPLMVAMLALSLALWAPVPRRKPGTPAPGPWYKIRRE